MDKFYEMMFGAASAEEILQKKTTGKQVRAIAGGKDNIEVSMTESECKNLCKACNDFEYLPGYESRIRQYTVTDESVDRYGDIVRARGMMLDNYKKNPVMQFAHDYSTPPIGVSVKTWYDKQASALKSLAIFYDDRVDTSGRSDLIFRFVKSNGMRACSIGFDPKEWSSPTAEERANLGLGQFGIEYTAADMLEFSPVPLPANPNCLSNDYRKAFGESLGKTLRSGLFTSKDVGTLKAYPLFEDSVLDAFIKELGTTTVVVPPVIEDIPLVKEPPTPVVAPVVNIVNNFDMGEVQKQLVELSNNIKTFNDILDGAYKSFESKTSEFISIAQRALSAVELSKKSPTLYDDKHIKGILKL